jgi:hypothetical protein
LIKPRLHELWRLSVRARASIHRGQSSFSICTLNRRILTVVFDQFDKSLDRLISEVQARRQLVVDLTEFRALAESAQALALAERQLRSLITEVGHINADGVMAGWLNNVEAGIAEIQTSKSHVVFGKKRKNADMPLPVENASSWLGAVVRYCERSKEKTVDYQSEAVSSKALINLRSLLQSWQRREKVNRLLAAGTKFLGINSFEEYVAETLGQDDDLN